MATTKGEPSARERLLAAANELFYEEGVHTVGIDRIIEHAGVAKASLYSTFGSKEELVRAYLELRAAARMERIQREVAKHDDPRAKILGVFDALAEIVRASTFRGCAFVNASAEGPRTETRIRQACTNARAGTRTLFRQLAIALGAGDTDRLGRQLALLYDGAIIGSSMESDSTVVQEARGLAEMLIDAAVAKGGEKSTAGKTKKGRATTTR